MSIIVSMSLGKLADQLVRVDLVILDELGYGCLRRSEIQGAGRVDGRASDAKRK
jgi:hypothetical protein